MGRGRERAEEIGAGRKRRGVHYECFLKVTRLA